MQRLLVFLCNRNLVPSGASGVFFQSNVPWRAACTDNFGLKQKLRSRFRVKVACGRERYLSFSGYPGLAVQRNVIKCALND